MRTEYDHVVRALDALPDRQRRALVSAFYTGLSATEIALVLGEQEAAVISLLHNATWRLRDRLDERDSRHRR
ncbi:RNA polymerase sigma factor [Antrihabitans cavernicola]|uniref:RNA polymerase sigma factor n=1 Tax=Antrihabitans cavernicola TaxID=2495913 RepID=UPI0016594D09|nr:sigma factor-like helix-turn-helix DNA-binding protein [Spelaeibacter cavernicola]